MPLGRGLFPPDPAATSHDAAIRERVRERAREFRRDGYSVSRQDIGPVVQLNIVIGRDAILDGGDALLEVVLTKVCDVLTDVLPPYVPEPTG